MVICYFKGVARNKIQILELLSGAEMDGVVHDQWIVTEIDGARVFIFDQDAVCSYHLVGETVWVEVSVMPIEVQEHPCDAVGFLDMRSFVGTINEISETCDGYNYLINVNGFQVDLSWGIQFHTGSCLKVIGRIDLVKVENETHTGWRTVI
jgi:hypothetical protein